MTSAFTNACAYAKGAFFWGYSGYSYSGLGITEYRHGMSISKRTLLNVSDLETESEVT